MFSDDYYFVGFSPSLKARKKFTAKFVDERTGREKFIHFGDKRYQDYTQHKDPERQRRYLARHAPREDWTDEGILTPGWWSRWLLWSEPELRDAEKLVHQKLILAGY